MRIIIVFLASISVCILLLVYGCGGEEAPKKPVPDKAAPIAEEGKSGDGEGQGGEQQEEPTGPEDEPEEPEPGQNSSRIWPDDPRARDVLPDPYDDTKKYSYWRDAKVGDWVRFLTHQQKLATYTVTERKGSKIKFQARHFGLDGKEESKEKPDIREQDVDKDNEIMRNSLLQNQFVMRFVYDWLLYKSDKVLTCERHFVPNPLTGEDNESCWSFDVPCGGFVFKRRGRTTYVVVIDYGDAEHPPKWDHLKPAELLKYWYQHNCFLDEEIVSQEDPPEGEPPEPPEE